MAKVEIEKPNIGMGDDEGPAKKDLSIEIDETYWETYSIPLQVIANIITKDDAVAPADTPVYILYKRRWFQLLLFCLIKMMNQAAWISLAPVAS